MSPHLNNAATLLGVLEMIRNDCFTGFTFNGIHSSTLNIVRIIDSNRIPIKLTPKTKDTTVDIPGAHLTEFFNSNYEALELSIPIAFDKLSEYQFRRLRQFFKTKNPYPLIFDENPYKVYNVVGKGTNNIKYICFENNGVRWYGGEATLNFVCYTGLARSRFEFQDGFEYANIPEWQNVVNDMTIIQRIEAGDPTDTARIDTDTVETETDNGEFISDECFDWLNTKDEWIEASDIKERNNYNKAHISSGKVEILLYNSGDLPTALDLYLKFLNDEVPAGSACITQNGVARSELVWSKIKRLDTTTTLADAPDVFVHINSKENSVKGADTFYHDTNRNYLSSFHGSYLIAPVGESKLVLSNSSLLPYFDKVEYTFSYY